MTKDNSTGKNKNFYELGKKMFDRLNPQIAHNPKVVGYVASQRTWVGLTWEEIDECFKITPDQYLPAQIYKRIEAKLKDKNT